LLRRRADRGKAVRDEAEKASIAPETYAGVSIGQAEDEVRKKVGEKGETAKEALFGQDPPIPARARCTYALSSKTLGDVSPLVYRFCFADGKLVEKRAIQRAGADPTGK
jgi:hypothetical protein